MSQTKPDNQGYTPWGEATNSPLSSEESKSGALHGSSHVWIWRRRDDEVEVLIQQRTLSKSTYPGFWDISAAGHIDFGETPLQAAIRETEEEINLSITPEDMTALFVHRAFLVTDATKKMYENEFQFVYGLRVDDLPGLKLQSSEVDATKWIRLKELEDIAQSKGTGKIVPHGPAYFLSLI